MKLEFIECKKCSSPMPKLRKELYGYDVCVKCSTVMPKVGRVLTYGQGEEIWNDLEIIDQESAKRVLELENTSKSKDFTVLGLLDFNQDSIDDLEPKFKNVGAIGSVITNFEYSNSEIIKTSEEEEEDDEEDLESDLTDDLLDDIID